MTDPEKMKYVGMIFDEYILHIFIPENTLSIPFHSISFSCQSSPLRLINYILTKKYGKQSVKFVQTRRFFRIHLDVRRLPVS